MFTWIPRRVSYLNVVATLILLFAMTGGALAAKKYLITSTRQISPAVLAKLKGAKGTNGAPGAQGLQGQQGPGGPAGTQGPQGAAGAIGNNGATGKEGPTGPKGATGPEGVCSTSKCVLPAGATETGVWSAAVIAPPNGVELPVALSFPIPLREKSEKSFYCNEQQTEEEVNRKCANGATRAIETTTCTGTAGEPTAPVGTLCVYTQSEHSEEASFFLLTGTQEELPVNDGPTGALLIFHGVTGDDLRIDGSFAVTAK